MNAAMDPIMSLKIEHETIRKVINNLEESLKKIGSGPEDSRDGLINRLNEITDFMDKDLEIHFKKEEDALFPVLGNYIGIETGPIHVMVIEHKNCRDLSGIFKANINNYRTDKNYKNIISSGKSLASLLEEHEDKEDGILFNIADMHLSEAEKQGIMEKMCNIE